MAERWLVISHEATNSGAPRVLLEVLRAAQASRRGWECEILLRHGGPLIADFARLGSVRVLAHRWAEGKSLRAGIYRKFFDRPLAQPRRLARWIKDWKKSRFDLVYNNTATNGYLVAAARGFGCPILTHVHELGYAMRRFNTPAALAQTLDNTDRFLAVSPAVAADLVECGARADRIAVTPNFMTVLPSEPTAADRDAWREKLNLPRDARVITGCGHIDWLKGTDLFVETAAALSKLTGRTLQFVWLGGDTDRRFARHVRHLVKQRGLGERVRFTGAVPDAMPWFVASDIVTITSRFESFPLVALEASALAKPVIGFAAARGLVSLLGDEPGLLVPRLEAGAMASTLRELIDRPDAAAACGRRLRAKVASDFLGPPRIKAILDIADELVKSGRTNP